MGQTSKLHYSILHIHGYQALVVTCNLPYIHSTGIDRGGRDAHYVYLPSTASMVAVDMWSQVQSPLLYLQN